MILTLVGVSYGTLDGTAQRARGVGADLMIRPPGSAIIGLSTAPMSDELIAFVASQPHVALATGTAIQPLSGFDSITGLDIDAFSRMSGGFHFLEGGPFQNDQDMLVDEYYAREKHLHVGDQVKLANHVWRIAGIFESGKLARMCVRLSVLQSSMGNEHRLSQIYVKTDSPGQIPTVLRDLRAKMPTYQIYSMEEFTSLLSINSVGLLRNFIGVVIGVAVIVGFIVVFMAMYTAVLERTREIGILKSMGASKLDIVSVVLRETAVMAAAGVLLGIAGTYGVKLMMAHLFPLQQFDVTGQWIAQAAIIAFLGAIIGALYPAWMAARKDPIDALAYE